MVTLGAIILVAGLLGIILLVRLVSTESVRHLGPLRFIPIVVTTVGWLVLLAGYVITWA